MVVGVGSIGYQLIICSSVETFTQMYFPTKVKHCFRCFVWLLENQIVAFKLQKREALLEVYLIIFQRYKVFCLMQY